METVDGPFELLDGDVVMMAPATFWHNQAVDVLNSALTGQAPATVAVAREAGIRLGTSVPIPDARHLVTAHRFQLPGGSFPGYPPGFCG